MSRRCVGLRFGLRVPSSQANVHDVVFLNRLLFVLRVTLGSDVGKASRASFDGLLQSVWVTVGATPSAISLVAGLTCVRLHLCKQLRMCTHTVSFRPGVGSSLKTHTPGPQHPWAPSFRLWMNTGSPKTSARCGFQRRLWAVVVIALRSTATTHPWAAAILMASLRPSRDWRLARSCGNQ